MRPLIAGNWKMNGLKSSLGEITALPRALEDEPVHADVLVCPPFTLVAAAIGEARGRFGIGAQDCDAMASGARTGDVSAEMLRDAGAQATIVGHSERRQFHRETDAMVAAKGHAARRAGLHAIVCVGETEAEYDAGLTLQVVCSRLEGSLPSGSTARDVTIAYEPIWAIGSGRTPTLQEIANVHGYIRDCLGDRMGRDGSETRILYGGSVKPSNAAAILSIPNVDGALVGGASLVAGEFLGIIRARS
jgi:triosephosphate isomerase